MTQEERHTCILCRAKITRNHRKCRSCAAKTRVCGPPPPSSKTCKDCGGRVGPQSTSYLCKSCATIRHNKLPEMIQKRREGWKKRLARPGEYERVCKTATRNSQKAAADPVKRAEAAERGRMNYARYLNTPEMRARIAATRKQAGEKIREKLLAWCPLEYREMHRQNTARYRMTAAQSREMIEKLAERESWERSANSHPCFSSVVHFMQRFTSIVERNEEGGRLYRVGLVDLTPGELLKRAVSRGYGERMAA